MLLFRYFTSHALETLRDLRLKVSKVSSFNDPFECMYHPTGEMTPRKAKDYIRSRFDSPVFISSVQNAFPHLRTVKAARRHMKANLEKSADALVKGYDGIKEQTMADREATLDRTLRVVCFSAADASSHDEILMWSHYSGSHRGVRVGFEFPDGITSPFKISPVFYQPRRVELDLSRKAEEQIVQDALLLSIKTKSSAWSYEREHRMITATPFCVSEQVANGVTLEFIPIKKEWVRLVDFGARFEPAIRVPFLEFVKTAFPHVECRQAKYHKTDYALEYDKL